MAIADSLYSMGSFSYSLSPLTSVFRVGRYCSIATGVVVMGPQHPYQRISSSPFTYDKSFCSKYSYLASDEPFKPLPREIGAATNIVIGNDVWIGEGAKFAKNVVVGDGAVIAGHSVVVKDVMPYTIVGGNPAKYIKHRFESSELISLLQEIKWWDYNFQDFRNLDVLNPISFAENLLSMIEKEKIQRFSAPSVSADAFIA